MVFKTSACRLRRCSWSKRGSRAYINPAPRNMFTSSNRGLPVVEILRNGSSRDFWKGATRKSHRLHEAGLFLGNWQKVNQASRNLYSKFCTFDVIFPTKKIVMLFDMFLTIELKESLLRIRHFLTPFSRPSPRNHMYHQIRLVP